MACSFLPVTGTSPRAELNENLHHIASVDPAVGKRVAALYLVSIHLLCDPLQIIFEGKVVKQPLSFWG